jgi:Ca2+-binding RTX toxin-like protein
VLQLGAGITESSLTVTASANGSDLVLTDGVAGDQITLDSMVSGYQYGYGVQQVQFADGTTLSSAQLLRMETTGTTGADTLFGTSGADVFDGKGGTDYERGNGGSDTFVFGAGYGHLEIHESYDSGDKPVLQLGAGITESSLTVTASANGSDLVLTDGVAGDQITLDSMASSYQYGYGVQQVQLADGTALSDSQLMAMARNISGTTGADSLSGTSGADVFDGRGGSDVETGRGGNDTYVLGASYGALTIDNGAANSNNASGTLSLIGVGTSDTWLRQVGNSLEVDVMGSSTKGTIDGWFSNDYSKLSSITTTDGSGNVSTLDSRLNQLIQAMANYSSQNPGFDPTSAANPEITDPSLLAAVGSAWHHAA